jgi:CheY-like chemotaxis protein
MARILVADDEADILAIIAAVCQFDDHEARTETTLEGTVEAFIDFAPDVMILDVNMSHVGGAPEILARLDKLGGTGACKVIVMSGMVDDEAGRMEREERVIAVVQKPFTVAFLRETIAAALSDDPPSATPPSAD